MGEPQQEARLTPRGLPWRVSEEQPWCVYAADGRLVAYAGPLPPDPNPVRAELDAAFIVEAVNAYFAPADAGASSGSGVDDG